MNKPSVLRRTTINWPTLGAAVSLGLFTGRIVSEFLRPGILGALLITLAFVLTAAFLFRNYDISQIWPNFLLLIYVFYPDAEPRAAAVVGLFTLFTYFITNAAAVKGRVKERTLTIIVAFAIGFFFLILYVTTVSTDVLPADSGEFQLVGAKLGVAHPPGFPLYTILANFFTRLPLGQSPAYQLNLFSALTSASALVVIFITVKNLSGSILGGSVAAGALGTATTFWAQGTTTNIRSLTVLFAALAFCAFVQFRLKSAHRNDGRGDSSMSGQGGRKAPELPILLLFFLAIAFGITHHPSLIFIATLLVIGIIATRPDLLKNRLFWLVAGISTVLALLPMLYLPIRAAAGAVGAPEDLNTFQGFINHVLALGFRGDFLNFLDPGLLWERMKVMANVMTFQFSPLLLFGMIVGLGLLTRKDWFLASLIGGSFLIHTVVSAIYRAPQTVEYMMPAYVPAAILLGYGAGECVRYAAESNGKVRNTFVRSLFAIFVSAMVVSIFLQLVNRYRTFSYLHNDSAAREYALSIFEGAPEDSVVLADWHWATSMWYLHEVENQRPDLDIHFVFPTYEPYAETWRRRIKEELTGGAAVVATHFNEAAYENLPPPEPLGDAFYFGPERTVQPEEFLELDTVLGDGIHLLGYKLDNSQIHLGDEIILTIVWKLLAENVDLSNVFGQLVDEQGNLLAFDDQPVQSVKEEINLTQLRLTPRPGTVPGEYSLLVGAYGQQPLTDKAGQHRTPLTTVQIGTSHFQPFTSNSVYREVDADEGFKRMIGYDWDNSLEGMERLYVHWQINEGYFTETFDTLAEDLTLPAFYGPWGILMENASLENRDKDSRYVPFGHGIVWTGQQIETDLFPGAGDRVSLNQNFMSTMPVIEDLVVSLRLVGFEEDGFHWDWWDLDDGVPVMGAIPTLKWIGGTRIRDPHWTTVSEDASPGQLISPLLRIYNAFTERAVPILDERISQLHPWVVLGSSSVAE